MVDEAESLVVRIVSTPVVLRLACRLLAANTVLSWLSVDICDAPVPNVMFVGVPPPVAAIVNVSPLSAGAARAVVAAVSPSLANALPDRVRSCAVPVASVILPPATVDGVVDAPVTASIAVRRLDTESPMPILVPALTEPATKVKTTPFTVSVSPVVMLDARSFEVELEVPESLVDPVIATGVALSLLTALPVTKVFEELPSRLFAVAPGITADETLDFEV